MKYSATCYLLLYVILIPISLNIALRIHPHLEYSLISFYLTLSYHFAYITHDEHLRI